MNKLQRKIGGPAASLDKASLVAAAERERQTLLPELEQALTRARTLLLAPGANEACSLSALFTPANEIRQLAASANRHSTGLLAHQLASYLTHCIDAGQPVARDIVKPLVHALEQSFVVAEGDPLLAAIVEESARLTRQLGIAD